jgi:DNA-binding beta-propeller fold protein YncE
MDGQKSFILEDIVTLKQFANAESMRKKNTPFYCEKPTLFRRARKMKEMSLKKMTSLVSFCLFLTCAAYGFDVSVKQFIPGIEGRPGDRRISGLAMTSDDSKLYTAGWTDSCYWTGAGDPIGMYSTADYSLSGTIFYGCCHGGVAVSSNDRYLFTPSYYEGNVSRFDLLNGNNRTSLGAGSWPCGIDVSPDGTKLVVLSGREGGTSGSNNDAVYIYDISGSNFSFLRSVPINDEAQGVRPVFSKDSRYAYVPTYKRNSTSARLYEISLNDGGTRYLQFSVPSTRLVSITRNEEYLFVSDTDNLKVWVVNPQTWSVADSIALPFAPCAVSMHPDGQHLFITPWQEPLSDYIYVYDTSAKSLSPGLKLGRYAPNDVVFAKDGKTAFVAHNHPTDGGITVLDISSGEPEWSFVQISDTHIRAKSVKADERLCVAVYEINNEISPKPDLILVTGDLADHSENAFYELYLDVIDSIKDKTYAVPGNHDRLWDASLSRYDTYINSSRPSGTTGLFTSNDYYFNHNGLLFIGLDSGAGTTTAEGPSFEQINSLYEELDNTLPKIMFLHHPAVDDLGVWHGILPAVWLYFMDYCETYNVDLVLAGHTHEKHVLDKNQNELSESSSTRPLFIQTPSTGATNGDSPAYRVIDVTSGTARPREINSIDIKKHDHITCSVHSPANLHVYDSLGKHVGIVDGNEAERGIPNSFYLRHNVVDTNDGNEIFPEKIMIFDPCGDYLYEVVGSETGAYLLQIGCTENGNETVFEANGIPTSPGQIHDYVIDWNALSQGQDGVTVAVDTDGDGDIEHTFTSDSNLTATEFAAATEPGIVDNLVSITSGLVSYDRRTGQYSTQIKVKNTSTTEIGEPVWLAIESISNPAVTLAGADGTTADGKPYFDLSNLLGDGSLSPGETISKRVYFNNPSRLKFTFTPSVRGVVEEEPPGGPS